MALSSQAHLSSLPPSSSSTSSTTVVQQRGSGGGSSSQEKKLAVEFVHANNETFQHLFGHPNEVLVNDYTCRYGVTWGRLYLSQRFFSFHGGSKKIVIPIGAVTDIKREAALLFFPAAIVINTIDHQEFCFSNVFSRDECLKLMRELRLSYISSDEKHFLEKRPGSTQETLLPSILADLSDDYAFSRQAVKDLAKFNVKPLKITIITIGSRGDVQPFIAFALGLEKCGHHVRIATHEVFRSFVEGYKLEFFPIGGDPKQLMELCVKNDMFTVRFVSEALDQFKGFVDELLEGTVLACQGADAVIATPSSLAGYHVAEKLRVPFYSAFTMPFSRTRAFPNPFAVPSVNLGGGYNYMTYRMLEQMLYLPIRDQINKWRVEKLVLPPAGITESYQSFLYTKRVPHLYCFSQHLVPKPPDWSEEIHVTGYWFLDQQSTWTPPADLVKFMSEGPPPVYIGFGSITIENPAALSKLVIDAVHKAGLRAILVKGWGGLGDDVHFPSSIYLINAIPHDWLFPQVAAVCHHGGAGTVAAGLKAGKPTIVVSFFGDQFFWGQRVAASGVGEFIPFKKLTTENLTIALRRATTDKAIRDRAAEMGKLIDSEDGVSSAVEAFHRHLDVAYVPPSFVPDSTSPYCMLANCKSKHQPFSLRSNPRHHCRNCGLLVCDACSKNQIPIPRFYIEQRVRVCDVCLPLVQAQATAPSPFAKSRSQSSATQLQPPGANK